MAYTPSRPPTKGKYVVIAFVGGLFAITCGKTVLETGHTIMYGSGTKEGAANGGASSTAGGEASK